MPVYTLNPSHKRSGSHKASRSPSLRERVAARRNPLSEDGVVVNPATAYNVYFGAKKVDTLYLTGEPSAEKVRARLIEDAGLDPRIRVRKAGAVSDTHGKRLGYEGLSAHVRRDEVPLAQRPARRRKPLATGAQRASTMGIKVSRDGMNYGKGDKRTKQTFETAFGTYASDWKAKNVTRLHVEGAGKSRWHDSVPEALRDIEARLRGGGSVEVVWYGGGGASVIDTITALSARRKNPLSEDGVVVSNPKKRKAGAKKPTKAQAIRVLKAAQARIRARRAKEPRAHAHAGHGAYAAEDFMDNPKKRTKKKAGSKRTGGRTAAQENAAKAMRLWHSGKASSLAEAWEMVRAGR